MKNIVLLLVFIFSSFHSAVAQLKWQNVDSIFQPLPSSIHVFKTTDSLEGKPNIAYYVNIDLSDQNLVVETDTTLSRRLTPLQFYKKNDNPIIVSNCTFFSFQTNQNLSTVIKNGRVVSHNSNVVAGKGKDSLLFQHFLGSAIGISTSNKIDIAWLFTDSSKRKAYAFQSPIKPNKDSLSFHKLDFYKSYSFEKWKMKIAVGGGPVLIQNNEISISNNEELKFAGKAISDKHPRTAMGYLENGQLIILVIQGRLPNISEGATLIQEAKILKDLGCKEAINLDGGGSSCLLINGKETIQPSDKNGQRAVPAVFLIKQLN